MGFEPMRGLSSPNRLAGGRTRPLCDPSNSDPKNLNYKFDRLVVARPYIVKSGTKISIQVSWNICITGLFNC